MLGAELFAALRAPRAALGPPPVARDAELAEVVHAGQHDRFPEQITAHGARQVVSQAAFGGRGGRGTGGDGVGGGSRSHGEGQVSLLRSANKSLEESGKTITAFFSLKINK